MTDKEILDEFITHEKFTNDTIFYRQTGQKHIITSPEGDLYLEPREDATEMVEDIYGQGHLTMAKNIGRGLAFTLSKENDFTDEEKVCVSIKLKDFLDQGGRLYPDKSSYEEGSYFLMLPEGNFLVNKED